jgi:hypothetical protein
MADDVVCHSMDGQDSRAVPRHLWSQLQGPTGPCVPGIPDGALVICGENKRVLVEEGLIAASATSMFML